MPLPIEDYAMIGDGHSAALVGRDGSIDWLCLPRFDSGACFAALFGGPDQGRWLIAPRDATLPVHRRYRDGTLVLETDFETAAGAVRVIDCMPLSNARPLVLRLVVGLRGRVAMRMALVIRFDHGSMVPWVSQRGGSLYATAGPNTLALHTPVATRGEQMTTQADGRRATRGRPSHTKRPHPMTTTPPTDAHTTAQPTVPCSPRCCLCCTAGAPASAPGILVIDVGGSHVKCLLSGQTKKRKFASGPGLTPQQMVQGVLERVSDWRFDRVAIGYPGVVRQGVPALEPHHLAPGWVGFDFEAAFGRPVRLVNDAAMQALGSYQGGTMLFLGLGTGLGSALIVDGLGVAMELGHLRRSHRHDYEDQLGKQGYKRLGKKKWRRKVAAALEGFRAALLPDEIVVGGGRAKHLKKLPPRTRCGHNAAAFLGGFRLWREPANATSTPPCKETT